MNSAVINNQTDFIKCEGEGALNKRNDVKANKLMMMRRRGALREGRKQVKDERNEVNTSIKSLRKYQYLNTIIETVIEIEIEMKTCQT